MSNDKKFAWLIFLIGAIVLVTFYFVIKSAHDASMMSQVPAYSQSALPIPTVQGNQSCPSGNCKG